jgi:cholesterol oxidase
MGTTGEKAARDLVTRLWWRTEGSKGFLFNGLPDYDRGTGSGLGSANTWHPLGGMVMGKATDFSGRSVDYPNLYCVDGSALPGSTCLSNPSLTITANAERCMDRFIAAHA